jgi:hypothetical protein
LLRRLCLGNLFSAASAAPPVLLIGAEVLPGTISVKAGAATTLDLYGHLCPGDMDRYSDRLGEAAEAADPAIIRPDKPDGDQDES